MFRSLVVFLWTLVSCIEAFQIGLSSATIASTRRALIPRPSAVLYLSSNDDDTSPAKRRRKRVKRKESVVAETAPSAEVKETPTVPDLKPRDSAPIELEIKDVRDVVSGKSSSSNQQQDGSIPESGGSMKRDSNNAGSTGDSLEQLLADAKAMRKDVDSPNDKAEGDASIQETVRNVLSTIVTIDFFVVCALLLWFLAGIFGSYVLKNDTVQIAFNSIFQQVVQPALGILMIGSAASGTWLVGLSFSSCFAVTYPVASWHEPVQPC